jgi:TrpR-related protein YerC/YecD
LIGGAIATPKYVSDEELQRLYDAFSQTRDPEQVKALMEDLCTIREINEMAQRLTVAVLLDEGESYTAIGEKTGASATTIARVSKCLNYGTGGYRTILDK